MTNRIRMTLEIGPKGKKAVAPDLPGLERGAKTEEEAIERLHSYIPRYSQVAKLAEMNAEFDAIKNVAVVEQLWPNGFQLGNSDWCFSPIRQRDTA